ncbi:Aldehyde/histidinol dehydrogenase [Xylariaceae sp. FL1272]|nr:Aldehyde/histidinol dehydrogenase [Xylariaceae sp. FL1272]
MDKISLPPDIEQWLSELTAHLRSFPTKDLAPIASLITLPVLITAVGTLVFLYSIFTSSEATLRYRIPEPKLPEEHKILENPSIKTPGSTAIQCYAPATGQFLGFVNPSTPAGLDRSIAQATEAQKSWAKTTFAQRRAVLQSMLQHVLDNQETICKISSLDSGKTMIDAQLGEIMVTAEKLQWTIKHGEAALLPSKRPTNLLLSYKKGKVIYEPLGVVAALVSWNYPFHNLIGPIISAIFAGNGIVVKVSEQTCWSSAYYTSIARGALVAHGHDPSLIQTVVCWPQTAGHLTSHPGISHITFIGSRPVCHSVAASAAKSLTPVVAELGGKDAAMVLDSAKRDLPRIADILLRGTFQASGQNCIGIERIIATPGVYDTLLSMLTPKVQALRLGLDKDVGAMVSNASFTRLEKLVEDAVSKGARLLAGGKRYIHPDHPQGYYFTPTLLADVTPDMDVANEECFGPIMTLMRSPTSSAFDVLALANAPHFGLGASVYGKDSDPELKAIVAGVRAGGVAVNDFAVFYAIQLPFGGVGGSGYGRFAGEEGLRGLCNAKSICEDRFGSLGLRTAIPPPAQYPVPSQEKGWRFTRGVVGIGYGIGLWDKAWAVVDVLRNM